MFKRLSFVGVWLCVAVLGAAGGQWTYDSAGGLLTHDTSGWVLNASITGTNLTVTEVNTAPATASALPLADPLPGFAITDIGYQAFAWSYNFTGVTIPNSVTNIGVNAFWNCSLTNVTIPDALNHIGLSAFGACFSLTSIDVANENSQYASFDGILYTRSLTELIQCPAGKTGTVTIPDSVTSIGDYAFYGCSNLTGVTIPDSVTSIGGDVFGYCNSLAGVMIGNGVTRIGNRAFEGCGSLTQLVLPASLNEIGYGAFSSCSALNTVLFEGAYPARPAQGTLYEENNVVTSYVYTAHAGSWDPYVADAPLAGGNAMWQGWPMRLLPNPTANITVTFDKRGGSFADPTAKTVYYGQSYGTLPVPTREGHRFDGWWTGINGAGLPVTPATTVSCARDHALYAKWLLDVTAEASAVLGTTNLVWHTQEAPANWRADAETTYDEDGSMRSADRGTGIPSTLRSTVTGPGLLQFRWRTASEDRERTLNFCVDGAERVPSLSGETGWQKVTVSIPAGEHTVEWAYDSTSGHGIGDGLCAGWLDQVVWPAVAHTPEEHFWLWENGLFGRSWVPEHLVRTRDGFDARIQDNPADMAARVYRAVATLALLSENPELRDLTESFGLTLDTNLFSSAVAFTGTAAPSANEAVDRTATQFLPALDAALADLESVPSDWDGTVELTADATGFDETVYVDLADVLLAKSYLYAARAAIQLAQAYDLTVDYAKTNVTQTVIAPFELPLIADPFNDAGFTAWESVPTLLYGSRGCLAHGSFARSDTQVLLLLRVEEGIALDNVYARLTDGNGPLIRFELNVEDLSENQVTNIVGYEWVSQIDQEIEVAYSILKSSGLLLIARNVAWGPEPVKVVEASAYVDGFNVAENGYTDDWADWAAMTRVQPASRFLEDHPACMQTVRDAAKLPFAKESLRAALRAAQAADSSITGRTDGAWHAIEFAPDQTNVLAEARQKLSETLASLDAPQSILFCHTNVEEVVNGHWEEIYDSDWDRYTWRFIVTSVETQRTEVVNQTERVHIGALFASPYLTRSMLPRFADGNEPVLESFPDPTFGGVLPAWGEQQLETNLLGRMPVMRERIFQMGGGSCKTPRTLRLTACVRGVL